MIKVAIVDDRSDCMSNLRQVVQACGYETVLVKVGDSGGLDLNGAIAALQAANPDFVLLDHDMGWIKGLDVAEMINLHPDKLIGTSTSKQSYCGRRMPEGMDKSLGYTLSVEKFQKLFA